MPFNVTLPRILKEVSACTICAEHLPLGPRPLIKVTAETRVLLIGQAPGRLAHESGVPWNDPSGVRLREWLGVTSETFYDDPRLGFLPMGFCFPGTGAGGDMPPRPECAPAWHERLLEQMPKLGLRLVLGRHAHRAYLPDVPKTVTATVQQWKERLPESFPLPHPSPRNNRWLAKNRWFEAEALPELKSHLRQQLGR